MSATATTATATATKPKRIAAPRREEHKDRTESVAQHARRTGKTIGLIYTLIWSGRIIAHKDADGKWRIPIAAE